MALHVLLLGVLLALVGGLGHAGDEDGAPSSPAVPATRIELAPSEQHLIEVLRTARARHAKDLGECAAQIASVGNDVIEPCLRALETSLLPARGESEEAQRISEPQRDILLQALQRLDGSLVHRMASARLEAEWTPESRRMFLWAAAASGAASTLSELPRVALDVGEEALDEGCREAFQRAVAGILRREPSAFKTLPALLRGLGEPLRAPFLEGVGDSQSPRALELFAHALTFDSSHVGTIAAQVRRVGASSDLRLNREVAERLRSLSDTRQRGLSQAIVLALGELRDESVIPVLIESLDLEDAGLRETSYWALKRITGLQSPAKSAIWRAWYDGEQAWFERERTAVLRDLAAEDPAIVADAIRGLAMRRLHRDEVSEDLLGALERREANLRTQACEALGALASYAAVPALIERLADPAPACVEAARRALVAITGFDLPADAQAWRDQLALQS